MGFFLILSLTMARESVSDGELVLLKAERVAFGCPRVVANRSRLLSHPSGSGSHRRWSAHYDINSRTWVD